MIAYGLESLHVSLWIRSRLSGIECPSGSGPNAPRLGLAGDTLGFFKKRGIVAPSNENREYWTWLCWLLLANP